MTLADFYQYAHTQRANILKRVPFELRGEAEDVLHDAILRLVKDFRLKGDESAIATKTQAQIHAYLCKCVNYHRAMRVREWLPNRVCDAATSEASDPDGDHSILDGVMDERLNPEEALLKKERMTAFAGLTGRQAQVLAMVQDGLSVREIARQLGVSFQSVSEHVKAARKKISA